MKAYKILLTYIAIVVTINVFITLWMVLTP